MEFIKVIFIGIGLITASVLAYGAFRFNFADEKRTVNRSGAIPLAIRGGDRTAI